MIDPIDGLALHCAFVCVYVFLRVFVQYVGRNEVVVEYSMFNQFSNVGSNGT